jgi:UDP-N-acetylglucosamine 2-epimerase (non-hydrolysing)
MKVMTIVGTRPEIIKLSRVIHELDQFTEHILVHTGQNYDYELNEIFFQQLGIRKPDHFLEAAAETAAETIGNVIAKSDVLLQKVNPDAVLLYGDTNSCLAVISAKRRKIPIFHMEAGNRCFDQRVPEEINRKIVDHLSDINMPLTEHARRYLLAEGIRPETVIKTGSTMKEVLTYYMPQIQGSKVLAELGLTSRGYFVVSAHREENVDSDDNFRDLLDTLRAVAARYKQPVIVSTHPRTRKRLEQMAGGSTLPATVRFLKPLGFLEYVKLQLEAHCVISDSGTITEESSILGFPAVMVRQAHERPEGMDEGTLIMCGLRAPDVMSAIEVVTAQSADGVRSFRLIPDYDVDNVSKKVLRIILSYTDYVNRTTWHSGVSRPQASAVRG